MEARGGEGTQESGRMKFHSGKGSDSIFQAAGTEKHGCPGNSSLLRNIHVHNKPEAAQ